MKLIRFILRNNRSLAITATLGGLISGCSAAVIVALIGQSLAGISSWTISFIGFFIGPILVVSAINLGSKWLVIKASTWTTLNLRMQISGRILSASLRRLEEIGNPRLLAGLIEDVLNINTAINTLPVLSFNAAIIIGALGYLAWLSPLGFLFLIIFGVPAVFVYQFLKQKVRQELKASIEHRNQQFESFTALIEGIKELKINRQRRWDFNDCILKPTLAQLAKTTARISFLQEAANTWSLMIFFIFALALILLSTNGMANIQVLTGFTVVVLFIRSSLVSTLTLLPDWDLAQVSLENIESLGLSLAKFDEHGITTSLLHDLHGDVCLELRGIVYAYAQEAAEDRFTLGPINLKFSSGELVFITGGNGCGKTTLLKVITSLYMPEKGELLLNGKSLDAFSYEEYRQFFSTLFSDYYLFEQLLGFRGINLDAQAAGYLAKLQLNSKVKVISGHLSTTKLSFGQRKRLALLTAYLEDRPIYIFDEWAAGQDPHFKEIFYRQILPELKSKGKLVIVVSHDNFYYDIADRIIRLNDGRVEYDLSPEELIDRV